MTDRLRSPSPATMTAYSLSCRSSPDPAAYERHPRSGSPDGLLNSARLSLSFGDISNVGSDRYSPSARRNSLLSSPRYSDISEHDYGSRPVSPSRRSSSQEEIIANHKRLSKLQQDLMAANKKNGRLETLYEETNKRKIRLQEELLEACTKVAKLEATCGSYRGKEAQIQQELCMYRQQNNKLEMDVLAAFKKVSQLESELETTEKKKSDAQRENISAHERVSVLEATVEKMKWQQSNNNNNNNRTRSSNAVDFTVNSRRMSELEAKNARYLKENDELRQEIRRVRNEKMLAEDELNKSLVEKANLGGQLNVARETPRRDESLEILLDELNRVKELYQNALKTNPGAKDYEKLLTELGKHKDECSKANERLRGMLEYEAKFKGAKVKEEQLRVELSGAQRKLSLAEEQLQKSLKEKAKIAMEVGKSNDKGMKTHEKLLSLEKELDQYKNTCEERERQRVEAEDELRGVLDERDVLMGQCRDLSKEIQENDMELEELLKASEDLKSKLGHERGLLVSTESKCAELTRSNGVLLEDLEESNEALAKARSELTRCKKQVNEYKDQGDAWEQKETERNKRVKQLALDVDEATEKLDKKDKECVQLENKLKKSEEERESVTEELDGLHDRILELESQLNRVERQRNDQQNEHDDLEERSRRDRDEMKKLRKELDERKSESEKAYRVGHDETVKRKQCLKEIEVLEVKYNTTVGKLAELERKYDVVSGERQELRREVLRGESEVAQLERSLNLVNKEKTDLIGEITALTSSKTKQDNVVLKTEKQLLELKEQHETLVTRNQDDQVKLKKQSKELEDALERMNAKSVQVEELIKRCEALKLERKELREDVHNVNEQCSRVQSQLDKEFREKENIIEELSEMTRKVKRREEELENSERKLQEQGELFERGNRRVREEQGQIRFMKQELETKTENYEELGREFANMKAKHETLLQEHNSKKKEVSEAGGTIGKLEAVVSKLEREKAEFVSDISKRESATTKQNEIVLKLQKQVKENQERLASAQHDGGELKEQNVRLTEENRGLFKQVAEKNAACVELETSLKEAVSRKSGLAREVKKLEGKCDELEKQAESAFREKLKLTEELKANQAMRERSSSDVSRYKEQAKEYRNLYDNNLRDAVTRRDSLDKQTLKNEELHKKYSKVAIELSEVEKRLEEAKTSNTKLKKECFMKQTKVGKLEALLLKAMQENEMLREVEKELMETQDELHERTNEVEHLEVEVNTLKLHNCDLEASKFALEKSNVILKGTNESERVKQSLVKLQDLQKDFQKTRLEKEVLEKRMTEARSMMIEKEAQEKELTRIRERLQECTQQLNDQEFQLSFLRKENHDLKESVGQLKDEMVASEGAKKKLSGELRLALSPKKYGYSRGALFIGNQDTESRSDVSTGPLTSTPLTSPRVVGSKSFELPQRKPQDLPLDRKHSLDLPSTFSTGANRLLHGSFSTSLDNLVGNRDWPGTSNMDRVQSDKDDVIGDMSFESLDVSETSMDSMDGRAMSDHLGNSPVSPSKAAKAFADDWDALLNMSSTVGPGIFDDDEDNMSDTGSVKDLKQHFELQSKPTPPPSKLPRRSLSRTPSLTTLVEKHEEFTAYRVDPTADFSQKTSPVSPNVELDVIIHEDDTTQNNEMTSELVSSQNPGSPVPSTVPDISNLRQKTSPMSPNVELSVTVRENDATRNTEMTPGQVPSQDPATKLSDTVPSVSDTSPKTSPMHPNAEFDVIIRENDTPVNSQTSQDRVPIISDQGRKVSDVVPSVSDLSPSLSPMSPNVELNVIIRENNALSNPEITPEHNTSQDPVPSISDQSTNVSDAAPSISDHDTKVPDRVPDILDRSPKSSPMSPNVEFDVIIPDNYTFLNSEISPQDRVPSNHDTKALDAVPNGPDHNTKVSDTVSNIPIVLPNSSPMPPNVELDVIIRENYAPLNSGISPGDNTSKDHVPSTSDTVPSISDQGTKVSDAVPSVSDLSRKSSPVSPNVELDVTIREDGASPNPEITPRHSTFVSSDEPEISKRDSPSMSDTTLNIATDDSTVLPDRVPTTKSASQSVVVHNEQTLKVSDEMPSQASKEITNDKSKKKRRVNVKNMKSLWQDRQSDQENIGKSFMKIKQEEVPPRKPENIAVYDVVVVNDDDDSGTETAKPAANVSHLVNLFSNPN